MVKCIDRVDQADQVNAGLVYDILHDSWKVIFKGLLQAKQERAELFDMKDIRSIAPVVDLSGVCLILRKRMDFHMKG